MNASLMRRLDAVEQQRAKVRRPAPVYPNVAAWLQTLSNDQLDRLEGLTWAWQPGSPIPTAVLIAVAGDR